MGAGCRVSGPRTLNPDFVLGCKVWRLLGKSPWRELGQRVLSDLVQLLLRLNLVEGAAASILLFSTNG